MFGIQPSQPLVASRPSTVAPFGVNARSKRVIKKLGATKLPSFVSFTTPQSTSESRRLSLCSSTLPAVVSSTADQISDNKTRSTTDLRLSLNSSHQPSRQASFQVSRLPTERNTRRSSVESSTVVANFEKSASKLEDLMGHTPFDPKPAKILGIANGEFGTIQAAVLRDRQVDVALVMLQKQQQTTDDNRAHDVVSPSVASTMSLESNASAVAELNDVSSSFDEKSSDNDPKHLAHLNIEQHFQQKQPLSPITDVTSTIESDDEITPTAAKATPAELLLAQEEEDENNMENLVENDATPPMPLRRLINLPPIRMHGTKPAPIAQQQIDVKFTPFQMNVLLGNIPHEQFDATISHLIVDAAAATTDATEDVSIPTEQDDASSGSSSLKQQKQQQQQEQSSDFKTPIGGFSGGFCLPKIAQASTNTSGSRNGSSSNGSNGGGSSTSTTSTHRLMASTQSTFLFLMNSSISSHSIKGDHLTKSPQSTSKSTLSVRDIDFANSAQSSPTKSGGHNFTNEFGGSGDKLFRTRSSSSQKQQQQQDGLNSFMPSPHSKNCESSLNNNLTSQILKIAARHSLGSSAAAQAAAVAAAAAIRSRSSITTAAAAAGAQQSNSDSSGQAYTSRSTTSPNTNRKSVSQTLKSIGGNIATKTATGTSVGQQFIAAIPNPPGSTVKYSHKSMLKIQDRLGLNDKQFQQLPLSKE